jgi:serine/threonine protein phosphatase PrpC
MDGVSGMKLQYGARTDVGQTRDHNEDNYGIGDDARVDRLGHLFVVCDGVGGHLAGEVASKLAVETILHYYYNTHDDNRPHVMSQAFRAANQIVYQQGQGSMGTTAVSALFLGGGLHVANVGDSRAYLIRNGAVRRISRDHSYVQEQVDAGLMTQEQAETSKISNIITRAMGNQPDVQVDLFREPLQPGDRVVLCSDGLHGLVKDHEIMQLALQHQPQPAVDQLIDLANQRGGKDNITVVLVYVESVEGAVPGGDDPLLSNLLMGAPAPRVREADTAEIPTTPAATPAATPAVTRAATGPTGTARIDDVPPAAPAQATVTAPVTQPPPPPPQPQAAPQLQPPPQPAERKLGKAGLILALILLALLLAIGAYLMREQLGIGGAAGAPTPSQQRATRTVNRLPTTTDEPSVVPTEPTPRTTPRAGGSSGGSSGEGNEN